MTNKSVLDIKQVMAILPHRYPFLLIDKVIEVNPEVTKVVAQKNVTFNEPFFQGHFPPVPLMPGVLILEALAQTGGILIRLQGKDQGRLAVLLNITNAKFRAPVTPGDVLILTCEAVHITTKAGKVKAFASVDGKVVCDAEISFALVDPYQI